MNTTDNNRLVTFGRVDRYGAEHPLTPANPQATDYYTQLKLVITEMETAVQNQLSGNGEGHGGTVDRRRLAKELRASMRQISKTARTLDPALFPGLAEELRLPKSQKFEVLLAAARAFLARVTPIKATFVERGLETSFDVELGAQIAALEAATERKHDGGQTRRAGTLGLKVVSRRGMGIVRGLDAIISNRLRKTDPVLLGVWKTASKVQSEPVRPTATTPSATTTLAVTAAVTAPAPAATLAA
jgi:hypothetical protein